MGGIIEDLAKLAIGTIFAIGIAVFLASLTVQVPV